MERHKDNLTDLVEHLQQPQSATPPTPPIEQQVVNNNGEIITLGHKTPASSVSSTNKSSLELPVAAILEAVTRAFDKALREILRNHR